MFKGFLKSGQARTTVANNQMFAGFPSLSFGNNGNIGGIPTTGLMAWFNPSVNITLDGSGNVSQWQDTSGTYTFAQSTSTARPAYVQGNSTYNYRPYLSFNGTSDYIFGANGLSVQSNMNYQVIIIAKYNVITSNDVLIQSDAGTNGGSFLNVRCNSGPAWGIAYTPDSGTQAEFTTSVTSDTNIHMFGYDLIRGSSTTFYLSQDYAWRTVKETTGISVNSYSAANIYLASPYGGGIYDNVYIFDVFFYNSILSQSDYLMLRGYMGSLYGF